MDAAEVVKAAKQESAAASGVSTLREYQIRSLIGGRVIDWSKSARARSLRAGAGSHHRVVTIKLSARWSAKGSWLKRRERIDAC